MRWDLLPSPVSRAGDVTSSSQSCQISVASCCQESCPPGPHHLPSRVRAACPTLRISSTAAASQSRRGNPCASDQDSCSFQQQQMMMGNYLSEKKPAAGSCSFDEMTLDHSRGSCFGAILDGNLEFCFARDVTLCGDQDSCSCPWTTSTGCSYYGGLHCDRRVRSDSVCSPLPSPQCSSPGTLSSACSSPSPSQSECSAVGH